MAEQHHGPTCPTCGAPLTPGPGINLADNTAIIDGRVIPLTPREAEVLSVLIARRPSTVSEDGLLAAVYGRAGDEIESNAIQVHLSHLRRRLRGLGWRIENVWGRGWRIARVAQ